ncbi:hypothetical protein LSTR_LSTR014136 [Laodelphax striatellus]|uniref:Kazal-like domain-containing protein n=1 Tax=Laodelphax striatellus TaxID=195883 RepID=A0A482XC22_LAOST|nr:hypothetical protein LSTR_LSTR014136 [Laodelphax striatellus]
MIGRDEGPALITASLYCVCPSSERNFAEEKQNVSTIGLASNTILASCKRLSHRRVTKIIVEDLQKWLQLRLEFVKAASQKAKCELCSDDYKPVCGHDAAGKPVTFGNACVLKKAACESGKQYTKQYDGECKNGGAVRLQ